MDIKKYIIEFEKHYNKIKTFGSIVSDDLLAYRLMERANLSKANNKLLRATAEWKFDDMKSKLKSLFLNEKSNSSTDTSSSVAEVNFENINLMDDDTETEETFYGYQYQQHSQSYGGDSRNYNQRGGGNSRGGRGAMRTGFRGGFRGGTRSNSRGGNRGGNNSSRHVGEICMHFCSKYFAHHERTCVYYKDLKFHIFPSFSSSFLVIPIVNINVHYKVRQNSLEFVSFCYIIGLDLDVSKFRKHYLVAFVPSYLMVTKSST